MISTLFAWENHPRVAPSVTHPKTLVDHEVSHSIGLVTLPAGPVALLIGSAALLVASRLRRGNVRAGWETLVAGLAGLGMSLGEFTQLLLGRRNYLRGFPDRPSRERRGNWCMARHACFASGVGERLDVPLACPRDVAALRRLILRLLRCTRDGQPPMITKD
jgi:hypothetical protein